jgi:hypothetical protein
MKLPKRIEDFFRETGAKGGKARAKKHTGEELSKWGKLGGRPPKRTKKGGK